MEELIAELVQELEAAGFYKYAGGQITALKQRATADRDIFGDVVYPALSPNLELPSSWNEMPLTTTGRLFGLDAESLAEGGSADALRFLTPYLVTAGMRPLSDPASEETDDTGVFLTASRSRVLLYTHEEAESRALWSAVSSRFLEFVNRLMQRSASEERVYALYGGNDLCACLLTPKLFHIIGNTQVLKPEWKPYETCPTPPWRV